VHAGRLVRDQGRRTVVSLGCDGAGPSPNGARRATIVRQPRITRLATNGPHLQASRLSESRAGFEPATYAYGPAEPSPQALERHPVPGSPRITTNRP
jgi:hypothetical protein